MAPGRGRHVWLAVRDHHHFPLRAHMCSGWLGRAGGHSRYQPLLVAVALLSEEERGDENWRQELQLRLAAAAAAAAGWCGWAFTGSHSNDQAVSLRLELCDGGAPTAAPSSCCGEDDDEVASRVRSGSSGKFQISSKILHACARIGFLPQLRL